MADDPVNQEEERAIPNAPRVGEAFEGTATPEEARPALIPDESPSTATNDFGAVSGGNDEIAAPDGPSEETADAEGADADVPSNASPAEIRDAAARRMERLSRGDLENNPFQVFAMLFAFLFQNFGGTDLQNAINNPEGQEMLGRMSSVFGFDADTLFRANLSGSANFSRDFSDIAPGDFNEDSYSRFLSHLRQREGSENIVYKDSRGNPTVGVGHLVKPGDGLSVGDRISDARVLAFLEDDARGAMDAALRQAAEAGITDEHTIIILGSVNFQLGTGWRSKFPQTWDHIENGRYEQAIAELEDSKWNDQTPTRVQDFQSALARLDSLDNQPTRTADNSDAAPALNLFGNLFGGPGSNS